MNEDKIIKCQNCPHKKETNHWSSDDWDHMCDWICSAKDNQEIGKSIEWMDESHIVTPDWCPILSRIVIKSPVGPTLPNRQYTIDDMYDAFEAGRNSRYGFVCGQNTENPWVEYADEETFYEWHKNKHKDQN